MGSLCTPRISQSPEGPGMGAPGFDRDGRQWCTRVCQCKVWTRFTFQKAALWLAESRESSPGQRLLWVPRKRAREPELGL